MFNFKDTFKSIADKTQQKITEIQNNEELRKDIGNVLKQAQGKINEITEIKSTHQSADISENSSLTKTGINLKSDKFNAQPGETKWTPSLGQGLSFIFVSEEGIRGIAGTLATQNKLALNFKEITLTAIEEKNSDTIFSFLLQDGNEVKVSISCIKKSNQQELVQLIINNVHAVAPEIAEKKQNFEKINKNLESTLKHLQNNSDKIVFQQGASYRGGLPGFPMSADKPGQAYILKDAIVFHDNQISFTAPYNRVLKIELDFFQLRSTRAMFAGANMSRMLQEVKNTIAVTCIDDEDIERTVKFQIHGAATIPGEAIKAQEFLNYLLEFKGSFLKKEANSSNSSDPYSQLKKLKELKDEGIISEEEFEFKKANFLKQI